MNKVLFVVDERMLGGVSIVLENILNNMSRKNLDITVLVLHNNGDRLVKLPSDIKVIYGGSYFNVIDLDFSSLIKSKKIFKAIKKAYISLLMKTGKIEQYIKKTRKSINLERYDIEIAFKSGFCSLFVAYGDAPKKINWIHEDYKTYNKTKKYEKLFKTAFSAFDKHVVVSDDAAKSFNDIYGMQNKSIVIENYIDTEYIKEKGNEESSIAVIKSKVNLVTLGRFCTEKGFDRLIDAVNKLKEERVKELEKLKVYILGYGKDEYMLKTKINEFNLREYVQVVNVKEVDNNPYAFMKQCDLYVMTSRSESFGMVRIEALILGLPVITTTVANTEKMINNDSGIVVDNSTEGIYIGLKQVLVNPELVTKLKENVKKYSYDKENERIIAEIESILEGNSEK